MQQQEPTNFDLVLQSEPAVKAWIQELLIKGRSCGLALVIQPDNRLEVIKDNQSDSISLSSSLEQLKSDLIALYTKYPLPQPGYPRT